MKGFFKSKKTIGLFLILVFVFLFLCILIDLIATETNKTKRITVDNTNEPVFIENIQTNSKTDRFKIIEQKGLQNYSKLEIDSYAIKTLRLLLPTGNGCINEFYNYQEGTILSSNLDYNLKWIIAYQNVLERQKKSISCEELKPSDLFLNEELETAISCGKNAYYNRSKNQFKTIYGEYASTTLVPETMLKEKWEELFGVNSYQQENRIIYNSSHWTYQPNLNGYVLGYIQANEKCSIIDETMELAYQDGNDIVLVSKVTYQDYSGKNHYSPFLHTYRFVKDSSDNYYFYSLEREKMK